MAALPGLLAARRRVLHLHRHLVSCVPTLPRHSSSTTTPLLDRLDNTLCVELSVDPDAAAHYPNRATRAVESGHYVPVDPTPLGGPFMVCHSRRMASNLGLTDADMADPALLKVLSGDVGGTNLEPWATPYAVSVNGNAIVADQFNGHGYGDGRAASIGEFTSPSSSSSSSSAASSTSTSVGEETGEGEEKDKGEWDDGWGRWELQLKGAGPTPFARRFDGRAVLRSSIREFLVSEAMHQLGVATTRALSLVASRTDAVHRAWYEDSSGGGGDPRFRLNDPSMGRGGGGGGGGNGSSEAVKFAPSQPVMERCAITCRAAPSFIRVGQVELFSRRMLKARGAGDEEKAALAERQLRQLLEHAMRREFEPTGEVPPATGGEGGEGGDGGAAAGEGVSFERRVLAMLRAVGARHAVLSANWLRVGYVQGNMNSDNCLLSGRTMDYGPFGFMERYSPRWTPFTSDPEGKFGFERQPLAAQTNLGSLAQAVLPIIVSDDDDNVGESGGANPPSADGGGAVTLEEVKQVVGEEYGMKLREELREMRRRKLGLATWEDNTYDELWKPLLALLVGADYTILFRQLSLYTAADVAVAMMEEEEEEEEEEGDDEAGHTAAQLSLVDRLERAFYEPIDEDRRARWCSWLRVWLRHIGQDAQDAQEGDRDDRDDRDLARQADMRAVSPKYVPREWMLVEAYTAADEGDFSVVHTLIDLFDTPYDEHVHLEDQYYVCTPQEHRGKAGTAFYS